MAINKISDETKRFIKKKTASALPDRPGDFNIKASEIKSFLHKFVTDDDNSIFSEIDRIVDEVNLRTADIENTSSDNLQAHKSDTSAHNIPSQIDSKINTHNQSGTAHQDIRTGLSEVQSVATSNKNKLDTIEVGATADQTPAEIKIAYESNANTNAFTDLDKTKLEQIEAKAQVNKIENIIVNGVTQAIVSKGINLTDAIKEMIDNEIDLLIGSSPETLDTLKELADALGNDPNFATTVTNGIASKISKDFTNYLEKENLTGTEHLIINDNGTIKKVKSDLVRNDKLTAENIPSGKGTTISEELDNKVDIDLIETQLPDNLVYSDDLEEVEEPLIQVYNSQLLNGKEESELDVNSAIKDGDNNVIANTYYKKTDTVDNSTNSENAMKLYQDGSYVSSQFLNVAYATNAGKLGGKLESELNVNSANTATTATNAGNANKLNNKLESELNGASADSATNADKLGNFEPSHYATKVDLLTDFQLAINTVLVGVDNQQYLIIEDGVLSGSSIDIEFLVIPNNVTSIGQSAFSSNQLRSVVIPDSVTSIGNGAFGVNQLTSVVIGNGVTSIGFQAFQYNQLTSVVIPDSVITIGHTAFSNNQLISVVIPDLVTTIGNNTFSYNQLKGVVIPNSVTSIGNLAFAWNELTEIIFERNTPPTIESNTFDNNSDLNVIYVPDNSVNTYKTATYYVQYASIIKPISERGGN
jgi:hypothetical protein